TVSMRICGNNFTNIAKLITFLSPLKKLTHLSLLDFELSLAANNKEMMPLSSIKTLLIATEMASHRSLEAFNLGSTFPNVERIEVRTSDYYCKICKGSACADQLLRPLDQLKAKRIVCIASKNKIVKRNPPLFITTRE